MTTSKAYTPIFSLLYALIIAFSYHYLGQSYMDANDLASTSIFLLWIMVLYALPTILYFTFVVFAKAKSIKSWLTAFIITLFVIGIIYCLYINYLKLADWAQWAPGMWSKPSYYGDFTSNTDLDYLRLKLLFSHIPCIVIAVYSSLKFYKEQKSEIQNNGIKILIAIGLLLYFSALGYLLFSHAIVLAAPFLIIVILAYYDYYTINNRKILSRICLWQSLLLLFIILLCRGLFDDTGIELTSMFSDVLYYSKYLFISGVAIGLIYGIYKAISDKLAIKPFIKGAIWGISFEMILSPIPLF